MSSRRYRVYRDVENIECNEMSKIPNICIERHRPHYTQAQRGMTPHFYKSAGLPIIPIYGFLSNLDYFPCNETINFNEIDTGLDVCKTG